MCCYLTLVMSFLSIFQGKSFRRLNSGWNFEFFASISKPLPVLTVSSLFSSFLWIMLFISHMGAVVFHAGYAELCVPVYLPGTMVNGDPQRSNSFCCQTSACNNLGPRWRLRTPKRTLKPILLLWFYYYLLVFLKQNSFYPPPRHSCWHD